MAYTSFQNCTKQEYESVLYSGDARHKLKILFNNVELEDADRYCEKLTRKARIIPNGAKSFSLNNFVSTEIELILHNIDISIIQDPVNISIGTLVNNTYEYVPIGVFNIQDKPITDKNQILITLRDNAVKFDFNYNAQPLIEQNGGSATKLQILQDICTQANVTCNIVSFIGYLDEIGIYDNTITARQYIADLAEQAGKIATINRSGELIFVDLNNLTTWEIPLEVVESYEKGTSYKIGQVVYEDGIVRYETPTSNDDTLFIDGSNPYISKEEVIKQETSNNNLYELTNTINSPIDYLEIEGKSTQDLAQSDDNIFDFQKWYIYKDNITVSNGNVSATSTTLTLSNPTNSSQQTQVHHTASGLPTVAQKEKIREFGTLVNPNTQYTIRYSNNNNCKTHISVFFYSRDFYYLRSSSSTETTDDVVSFTFTTSEYTKYIALQFFNGGYNSSVTTLEISNISIKEGTDTTYSSFVPLKPSPFSPVEIENIGTYNSQTGKYEIIINTSNTGNTNTYTYELEEPIKSIGDVKDLLYIKNNMLYVQRNIGTKILNGTENWELVTTSTGDFYKIDNISDWNYNGTQKTLSISDRYSYEVYADTVGFSMNNNRLEIRTPLSVNLQPDLNTFKTNLAANNVEIQYILNEPYLEELGEITSPQIYEGDTNIVLNISTNTNSLIKYWEQYSQVGLILNEVNLFSIDSLKTGKILGNPAIDPYDIIQIEDDNITYKTLATNDLTYTGVLINTFDTQIEEEEKSQNVTISGEATFKKWAKTSIDNVAGTVQIQTGQISELTKEENNNYQEMLNKFQAVDESISNIDEIGNIVTQLQTNTYTKTEVQQIANGTGVDGVKVSAVISTSGTFDENGMTYEKTGAKTKTTINEVGVNVKDSSNNSLLFAGYVDDNNTDYTNYEGQTIVGTDNIIVKNYLNIGSHSRIQDYENGTGIFYM